MINHKKKQAANRGIVASGIDNKALLRNDLHIFLTFFVDFLSNFKDYDYFCKINLL